MSMPNVLVTGGSGGLGHAVVPFLARDYTCIVTYHRKPPGDLEGASAVALLSEVGKFAPRHALVHLAGAFAPGNDYAAMLEANLMSFASAAEAAVPHLREGGRIVAISSAATLTLPAGMAAYNASKGALNAAVVTLAHELAPRRITANALLPTALDTPAMRASGARDSLVPLDRVARWIAFLLSPDGAGVTGQLIRIEA
jgi:NAD(P)-dependent dehydrogenase (short-subunit alcohol dehydrogenase family)